MDTALFSQTSMLLQDPAGGGGAAPSHRPEHQGPAGAPGLMCKTTLHRFTMPRWKMSKSVPPNLSHWVDLVHLGVCVELVARSSSIHRAMLNRELRSSGVSGGIRNVLVITSGQSWREGML